MVVVPHPALTLTLATASDLGSSMQQNSRSTVCSVVHVDSSSLLVVAILVPGLVLSAVKVSRPACHVPSHQFNNNLYVLEP